MPVPMKRPRTNYSRLLRDALVLAPVSRPHVVDVLQPYLDQLEGRELIVRSGWQAHAACRGMETEIFFPTDGGALAPARRICARCPVAELCRLAALEDSSLQGIWAGTSARQRDRLRSAARRASTAHGSPALPTPA